MTAQLTKKRVLLDFHVEAGPNVVFLSEVNPDTGIPNSQFDFLVSDWEAMGRPQQVTVTIDPGDLLNT